jgi:phage terminase large subunit-like protein
VEPRADRGDALASPSKYPDLVRIVVAIDPAVSTGEDADETGIIVAGKDADGQGYVLADQSARYAPTEWARTAIAWRRERHGLRA